MHELDIEVEEFRRIVAQHAPGICISPKSWWSMFGAFLLLRQLGVGEPAVLSALKAIVGGWWLGGYTDEG